MGGFYYDGDSVNDQIVSIPVPELRRIGRSCRSTDPSSLLVRQHRQRARRTTNESVFAHVVFDITDKLALTAGVRYSNDEKDVDFDNTRVQNPNLVVEGDNTDYKFGIDTSSRRISLVYAS